MGAVELPGHQVYYGPENVATVRMHLLLSFITLVWNLGLIIRLCQISSIHFCGSGNDDWQKVNWFN